MLCTFTIKPREGTPEGRMLVIRSDDIRRIIDDEFNKTWVVYVVGSEVFSDQITGTARENMQRIQQEELDLIARIEEHRQQLQKRVSDGYPAIPVQRGRPR